MYIYKKHSKKYVLMEHMNTNDEYEIEELLIKIFRETIHKNILPRINIRDFGDYTLYYIEHPNVILLVSSLPLSRSNLNALG